MDEMRTSARIVASASTRLEELRGEPWIADDRKVVLPPREELHTSMESLIHHFKIVTEGYRVPEGEVYVAIESARGEYGCYLVSDGGPKPWRVSSARRASPRSRRPRPASATRPSPTSSRSPPRSTQSWETSTDERRPSIDEIQQMRRKLPETRARRCSPRSSSRRSAHGGWLPEEAFREVAEALDVTPAYCLSIASFYDMFHLEPVGRHRSRCARTSRARSTAPRRSSRRSSASSASTSARPPRTATFTLRAVECLGGCGWATVVAVDNRHRLHVRRRRTCRRSWRSSRWR